MILEIFKRLYRHSSSMISLFLRSDATFVAPTDFESLHNAILSKRNMLLLSLFFDEAELVAAIGIVPENKDAKIPLFVIFISRVDVPLLQTNPTTLSIVL